jgi:hypothetical protein
MMRGSSSSVSHPAQWQQLLALLQGCANPQSDQQQQQHDSHAGGLAPATQQGLPTASDATGSTTAASSSSSSCSSSSSSCSSSSSSFFDHLQHFECVDSPLMFNEQLWAQLPRLSRLNLSGSGVFRGVRLVRLQLLQRLTLNGEMPAA